MKTTFRVLLRLALLAAAASAPPAFAADGAWITLFDGRTFDGWRAAENPASFHIADGAIVCDGPRAHLFYVGASGAAAYDDFELSAEVRAKPGANSGIFFHTAWQESGWPAQGFEVQVNNSAKQHGTYLELKKTGSLYGIHNVYRQLVADDQWFTLAFTVRKPRVEIRVNGVLVVDYVESAEPLPAGAPKLNRLGRGTFALQAHDPQSVVHYRNLRVRSLAASTHDQIPRPTLDARGAQLLSLARDNFPLLDLHTHLKGGLTLDQALRISRASGIGLGIATNGGIGFPIQNDAAALAFLESMQGKPVFRALQAEGREWLKLFSPATRAKFDYIFTDAMTFTNTKGNRLRLWLPEESDIGADPQAFMEELVAQTVRIVETEPIDIFANPTFLPAALAARHDELWTEERMQRVIDAAVQHGVAIEINTRYKLPSEKFLRRAKAAGAKFTIGTNNTSADDFGDWSYALEMQKKIGLRWQDMFVPGHQPSRAQRELKQ